MTASLNIGQIIPPGTNPGRDAIHVAVIPCVATREMPPGYKLKHGVVDPFLTERVQIGQTFWLFLYPETTTGIRHMWHHPAFPINPMEESHAG